MLKITIFCIFLSLSSCLVKPMQTIDKNATPTPTAVPNLPAEIIEAPPASKEYNEVFYKEVGGRVKIKASGFGIKPLSSNSLGKEDIELRFYVLPSSTGPLYKGLTIDESVFIVKRTKDSWEAEAIRKVNKADKIEKIVEKISVPKSGWETLWQQLQTFEILNAPADDKDGFETEKSLYVIETKANGKYHYGYFHSPKKQGSTKEEQDFANIFSLIADEFNASDFKAN
jgi:hypothetical protein